jgi:hypothetical protein
MNDQTPTPAPLADLLREAAEMLADLNATADALNLKLAALRAAQDTAKRAAETAREAALDPHLADDAMEAAQGEAQRQSWQAERIAVLAERLAARCDRARADDEQRARVAAYEAAKVKRDAAAARLLSNYPELARQLATLCETVADADNEVVRINRRLPDGLPALNRTEGHLRGFTDTGVGGTAPAEGHTFRVGQMFIPTLTPGREPALLWPMLPAKARLNEAPAIPVADYGAVLEAARKRGT